MLIGWPSKMIMNRVAMLDNYHFVVVDGRDSFRPNSCHSSGSAKTSGHDRSYRSRAMEFALPGGEFWVESGQAAFERQNRKADISLMICISKGTNQSRGIEPTLVRDAPA